MNTKNYGILKAIVEYIDDYFTENGCTPSVRSIAKEFDIGTATAYRYLTELDENNVIRYSGGEISTPYTRKFRTESNLAAVYDSVVVCGSPTECADEVSEYVNLPVALFGRGDYFIITASHDSMTDAGIDSGDVVIAEATHICSPGDIVIVLDDDNRGTLKCYAGYDREKDRYILKYCNEEKYPGKTIEVSSLTVQGVVRQVIKYINRKPEMAIGA